MGSFSQEANPKGLQSYTMIYTIRVFSSGGLTSADMHHPRRVYFAQTVAGIAMGYGAASWVDYPDGPGHRGGSCNSAASSHGMDLPPAGRCCCWRVIV